MEKMQLCKSAIPRLQNSSKMSQCVPNWDLDDNRPLPPPRFTLRAQPNSNSLAPDVPSLDYEVAELTWENGQLAMHGLGPPRLPNKIAVAAASSPAKYSWDKPPAVGTLESIVDQAAALPHRKAAAIGEGDSGDELVPWFDDRSRRAVTRAAATSITMTMDALVPCSNGVDNNQEPSTHVLESVPGIGTGVAACSTRVGSSSGAQTIHEDARLACMARDWSSRADQSVSGSATCGRDNRQATLDTCEREFGAAGFASTSLGSPENTSSGQQYTKWTKTTDDYDSVCHSRNQEDKKKGTGKVLASTRRSRAAAIHNQSERKRRDKINQRMKTLQKLVPNSSKTDKASMLDEVIEYLKQLQAQVQMMRMNMSPLMLPLAMQQQLQMSMMAPMGMGINMGMGLGVMDLNTIGRSNITGIPPVLHPTAFMPVASWDAQGDRLAQATSAMPDPLTAFLACQSQPMTMDAYSRMATLYRQQFQQPPGPASKNKAP